jgi:hypothetical protein
MFILIYVRFIFLVVALQKRSLDGYEKAFSGD